MNNQKTRLELDAPFILGLTLKMKIERTMQFAENRDYRFG